MSVINTMLKDLELRDSADLESDAVLRGLSSGAHTSHRPEKEVNYSLIGMFGVLVIILVMVIIYLVSPYQLVVASKNEQQMTASEGVVQPVSEVNQDYGSLIETEARASVVVPASNRVPRVSLPAEQAEPAPEVTAKPDETVTKKPLQKPVSQKVAEAVSEDVAEEDIGTEQEISKTQREPSREEKSKEAYLNALSMYNRGRVQQSRVLLKDALNYDAHNLDAIKLLASIYLRESRADIAVTLIEKGLANYSGNQDLLRLYLHAQVQLENYAGAISIMEQHLRMTTPEDIAYLAGLYQKNSGHLSAVRLYSQALQLKPSKSVWWMGQGISLEALKQNDEALKSYQQSVVSGQLSTQLSGYVNNRIRAIEQMQNRSAS